MRQLPRVAAIAVFLLAISAFPHRLISRVATSPDFVHFESGHVHPLAMTPDGSKLLAVNTADNRLAVFSLAGALPTRVAEIPVGLEPVSVAARTNTEAWVVNTLSDDVSIVDLTTMHVRATVRVGDEPSDVVFAGSPQRAWISVTTDDAIKLFDPTNLATPPQVLAVPARGPRSLSVSADGSKVYAAIFYGSHGATVLSEAEAGDSLPSPNPPMRAGLPPAPKVGLIVNFSSGHWRDESGKLWDSKIKYTVPLVELVQFDAASKAITRVNGDLATIMLATAVNPVTGAAAVTGTYARIEQRFEPNLRGHLTETRVAIVPTSGPRTLVGLNPHINYAVTPGPPSERDSAIGQPTGAAWSADGQRLYVTSLASDRVAVVSATGTLLARVPTIAGPTGVVADGARGRLYVLGRFRNQLQTLSDASFASLAVAPLGFDPTPDEIVNGRRFFYGGFTSGHGDQSCASCHLFGDFDNLAWDLGNPLGDLSPVPPGMLDPTLQPAHPMKGPMVTQSLRGLGGTGVLHWRGDRADLAAFNPAFESLLGRAAPLPDSERVAFTDFVMPLVYPPNPRQNLDRTMPDAPSGQPSARRGQTFFSTVPVDAVLRCSDCHSLPSGTNGQLINKNALLEAQDMKIPQLRNMYKKTGFKDSIAVVNKRGFGFTHNGAVDDLFAFLHFPGFNFGSPSVADGNRRDVEAFLLAFDTGMAPAVGAQVTFDGTNGGAGPALARMDTLVAQADAGQCDLVAKGRVGTTPRGWRYAGGGQWQSDLVAEPAITSAQLRALASAGHELTLTGVPPGSGTRLGVDRDRDGYRDGDELAAGSDPGNPASTPVNVGVPTLAPASPGLAAARPNPFHASTELEFTLARPGPVSLAVHDLLGRRVRTLARGERFDAGTRRIAWDGRGDDGRPVATGVYFVRLETDGRSWTRGVARIR